jgi:hypothetical protein
MMSRLPWARRGNPRDVYGLLKMKDLIWLPERDIAKK